MYTQEDSEWASADELQDAVQVACLHVCPRRTVAALVKNETREQKDEALQAKEEKGIYTVHKRVADKIRPVSCQLPAGSRLESAKKEDPKPEEEGPRLTPERIKLLNFGPTLTIAEKDIFTQMLLGVDRCMAFAPEHLVGIDPEVELPIVIRTTPHQPWELRTWRLTHEVYEELLVMLKQKIRLGHLEFSNGAYSNRFFLVRKKNGSWRFILDVLELNSVTIKDANMPPALDHIIERFCGYPIYTTTDAASGYDQILLDERSRDMTAIWTPLGLLRYTRLPMGWTNSVAAFERFLSRILSDYKGTFVDNMLDDIVIRGDNQNADATVDEEGCRRFVRELIDNTRKVLKTFVKARLMINVEKTFFGYETVELLGAQVSSSGHEPTPGRLKKVSSWPAPSTVKELRGFLALCNRLQGYVPMIGEISAPLSDLLKGGKKKSNGAIALEGESAVAFERLKAAVRSFCLLRSPKIRDGDTLVLYTDAGLYAAGAVLTIQDSAGNIRPVRCASKIFNASQRKYNVPQKEVLAIVFGLTKLRRFLQGMRFVLRTDSQTAIGMLRNPTVIVDVLLQ
jgi:hypothetical protein